MYYSTCVCIACWSEHTCYHCADATIYVGGLDEKVTEALLWDLFLQAGPVGITITVTLFCGHTIT